jgi:hypothetical protein
LLTKTLRFIQRGSEVHHLKKLLQVRIHSRFMGPREDQAPRDGREMLPFCGSWKFRYRQKHVFQQLETRRRDSNPVPLVSVTYDDVLLA